MQVYYQIEEKFQSTSRQPYNSDFEQDLKCRPSIIKSLTFLENFDFKQVKQSSQLTRRPPLGPEQPINKITKNEVAHGFRFLVCNSFVVISIFYGEQLQQNSAEDKLEELCAAASTDGAATHLNTAELIVRANVAHCNHLSSF